MTGKAVLFYLFGVTTQAFAQSEYYDQVVFSCEPYSHTKSIHLIVSCTEHTPVVKGGKYSFKQFISGIDGNSDSTSKTFCSYYVKKLNEYFTSKSDLRLNWTYSAACNKDNQGRPQLIISQKDNHSNFSMPIQGIDGKTDREKQCNEIASRLNEWLKKNDPKTTTTAPATTYRPTTTMPRAHH